MANLAKILSDKSYRAEVKDQFNNAGRIEQSSFNRGYETLQAIAQDFNSEKFEYGQKEELADLAKNHFDTSK